MRENQNIAHCTVCSEKTHCRFSLPYIPHRLHSTESNFHSFLSLNLPNNMGDIWKISIQNGCRFITHSPTISRAKYDLGNLKALVKKRVNFFRALLFININTFFGYTIKEHFLYHTFSVHFYTQKKVRKIMNEVGQFFCTLEYRL